MKECIFERKDTGLEGSKKGRILERRDAGPKNGPV